jgi:hypothetical protein
MTAEPLLDKLIAALQQLRAQVVEGEHNERERPRIDPKPNMVISALALNIQLYTARCQAPGTDLERIMKQREALDVAIYAIKPDYSLEAVDGAIGVAEGQR